MPVGWNDTFSAGLQWSKLDFIGMFWEAMNERRVAIGQAEFAEPVAGANLQSATTSTPTIRSVTSMTRSGSTVSVTTSSSHGFTVGTEIIVTGANETDYNGVWTVATAPTATTFTFSIGSATPATPATGTITTFISKFSVRAIQDWLESNRGSFIDPAVDLINTPSTTNWRYTLASWRTAAGINSSGFMRKKPREISSTSASTDANSNSAVVGQRAWLTSGANTGKLHECTATGPAVWSLIEVRSEQQRVDLSAGDDPNGGTWSLTILGNTISGLAYNITAADLQTAIQATSGTGANQTTVSKSGFQYTITFPSYLGDVSAVIVNSSGLTSSGTISVSVTEVVKGYANVPAPDLLASNQAAPNNVAYGKQVAGDYIGAWLFTELRNGINALMRMGISTSTKSDGSSNNGPRWVGFGEDNNKTTAGNEWNASIAYDATGLNGVTGVGDASYSMTSGTNLFQLVTQLPESLYAVVQAELSGTAKIYLFPSSTQTLHTSATKEYDGFGTGLTGDVWNLWDTVSYSVVGSGTQVIESATDFTPVQPPRPSWPSAGPTAGVTYTRGFALSATGIADYNFVYHP